MFHKIVLNGRLVHFNLFSVPNINQREERSLHVVIDLPRNYSYVDARIQLNLH